MYLETTPNAHENYRDEKKDRINSFDSDKEFHQISKNWRVEALKRKYMNNFSFLGRPLIQLPMDALAMQELIWTIKPDVVIETGIAHGGSIILSASVLELIGQGEVIGVDIEIREHNRKAILEHPLAHRINLVEGSSTDAETFDKVKALVGDFKTVLVFLDSNHTHEHVFNELNLYAPLVSVGSYCVVFDTFVEDLPDDYTWDDRPWGKGNNPKTAVHEWIKTNSNFSIDKSWENKLMITSAPDGFLKRLK